MTHDEFEALPTAQKLAVRERDLKECREQLNTLSGKASYFRAMTELFGEQTEATAEQAAILTAEIDTLRAIVEVEKAAARAAKRKKSDAPAEPQPATENPT